jgi:hypothetical protein
MINLRGSLVQLYVTLILTSILGYNQALLCSWFANDALTAFVYFAMICIFEIVFSDFVIPHSEYKTYIRWIPNVTFTKWSIAQTIYNQFNDFKYREGDVVLDYYDFDNMKFSYTLLILISYVIILELFILYFMLPAKTKLVSHSGVNAPDSLFDEVNLDINRETNNGIGYDGYIDRSSTASHLQVENVTIENPLTRVKTGATDATLLWNGPRATFQLPRASFTSSQHSYFRISIVQPYNACSQAYVPGVSNTKYNDNSSSLSFAENAIHRRDAKETFRPSDILGASSGAMLTFCDVSYKKNISKNKPPVQLLHSIYGSVRQGEMCAIMGSSGAGRI